MSSGNGEQQDMADAMTYQEAAKHLGVSLSRAYALMTQHPVRKFKRGSGNRRYLSREDVERVKRERESLQPIVDGGE